ncbi:MAG: ATP-binding cassette domain-containing protein [Clostridia bacterium]|nr:ATP-binding cassette domain-containing protein [Clostridia bacterium]
MIEIKNLVKRYGQINAVDDISFTVPDGEILGFLGPNGAGKSTTMNMITGYLPPTAGTVLVEGYDIMEKPKEVKRRIGYLPELPPLYGDMTVGEYLEFICELKDVDKKIRRSQLDDIMYLVKIGDMKGRLVKNLSKGYRQRVGFAEAMVGNPKIMILDEPTIGLAPKQIVEIRKLIAALGKEHTVILSTHILSEVSAVCSSVVIINKGKIAASGNVADFAGTGTGKVTSFHITIAGPKAECSNILRQVRGVKNAELLRTSGELSMFKVESRTDTDVRKEVFKALADAGYPIMEIRADSKTLEETFIEITSKDNAERGI